MTAPGRLAEAASEVKSDEIPSATHLAIIRNLLDLAADEIAATKTGNSDLLLFLYNSGAIRVADLPDEFRNARRLQAFADGGLIELGQQRDPLPGEYPQTRKWDFWSQAAGDWPLIDALAESSDNEFPWHVRLTARGKNEASRLWRALDSTAEDEQKPATKTKRSTEKGEARAKLIAALTAHHQYAGGSCMNLEPVGNNELARLAGVSKSAASAFFNKQFGGHTKYRAACSDAPRLIAALKLLNQEFAPRHLYGTKPPGEAECEAEE